MSKDTKGELWPNPLITLRRDETGLTILPCPPAICELLTIKERKEMGEKPVSTCLAVPTGAEVEGSPVYITYQGFWRKVRDFCMEQGWEVKLEDYRAPFPRAHMELAHNMRFSQERLLREAVAADCSGLIGAPTRYGKSFIMANLCRVYPGARIIIAAPGDDLVRQLSEEMKRLLPGRKVKGVGLGRSNFKGEPEIEVISVDSLHKTCISDPDMLICDEAHAHVTDDRIKLIQNVSPRARRIGMGATLEGRYDRRDAVIEGLFGPVLSSVSYREAVAEGAICPVVVVGIPITFNPFHCSHYIHAMRRLLWQNEKVAYLAREVCDNMLPENWQTLLFIKNEDHAKFMAEALSQSKWPVAMAKLLTKKARGALTQEVADSTHMRVLCSNIFVQGMTFHDLRALVNLSGGGPYTSTIQRPGRLPEIRHDLGKKFGLLVDFFPRPAYVPDKSSMPEQKWWAPVQDGKNRLSAYQEIGYEVTTPNTMRELRDTMHYLVNF